MNTCPSDHPHGERNLCYKVHKCRCASCKKRNADYQRTRYKKKAYGQWDPWVPAEPVRAHIRMLQKHAYGVHRIAELAAVPSAAVFRCMFPLHGRVSTKIKRSTAEKVLALQPDPETWAPGARVPATGTQRRIRALVCMGWSGRELARRLGVERGNFWKLSHQDQVLASSHWAVAELYDELWDQPPPAETPTERAWVTRSRKYAAEQGWASPLAWDDNIDDPDAEPVTVNDPDRGKYDPIAVELAVSGVKVPLNFRERDEAITILHARHWPDSRIAAAVGCDTQSVARMRKRLGLKGWSYLERAADYVADERMNAA